MTLVQERNKVGQRNSSRGTHAAIAPEAQGAPERVRRRGMVATK
jgi:hypothetical protein